MVVEERWRPLVEKRSGAGEGAVGVDVDVEVDVSTLR